MSAKSGVDLEAAKQSLAKPYTLPRITAKSLFTTSPIGTRSSNRIKLFARGLGNADDLFEKRNPNPPAVDKETVFKMSYHDHFQKYWLAAWNGVPIAVLSSSKIETEPKVDYLIPIIDFYGWRWQAGAPTNLDFRFGFGVSELVKHERWTTVARI